MLCKVLSFGDSDVDIDLGIVVINFMAVFMKAFKSQ